jgi:pimeloyl-ACP methyl ester carboxylesterase
VPFTIVIPASTTPADLTALRIAVVQHGLGADRTSMLTVANTLAGKGIASILIDLPFHGARRGDAVDTQRNLTLGTGPDGFGESSTNPDLGFFDAAGNSAIGLPIANPRAIRGAFFQATNDIEQEFRMIESGDLSAIGVKEPRLATLKLDTSHEVYVGESFGSMIGTLVAAFQPGLVGTVLDVGGGGTVFPLLINSATFEPLFSTLLNGAVGATPNATDPLDTDFTYNLAEWLLEEGDALAYSPYVLKQQYSTAAHACNVLQVSAFKDELVPNPANLALARGIGIQPLQLSDGGAPDLTGWPEATAAMGMLSANVDGVTGAFIQFNPAVHTLMTERNGVQSWDLSTGPPFTMLNPPVQVMDPIDRVNQIVGDFIDAASKGTPPTVQ